MSVNSSVTPNMEDNGEATIFSILVVFLVLLFLLMAVLVAIVVYQIFIRYFRGTSNDGYAPVRLVRVDKEEKKPVIHGKHKFYRQEEKLDYHNLVASSAQLVLSYIDDLSKNKSRIDEDWKLLQSSSDCQQSTWVTSQTVWSAISIFDDDHHKPKYLVACDPQPGHADELWELVTRDHVRTIVTLSNTCSDSCKTFWPSKGTKKYGKFVIQLVSEHKHSTFVIRSFVVKGGQFSLTVTQYQLLNWPHLGKLSIKSLLEFRRKVNQSLNTPILIHCIDGIGRTGTYCLIDIVLNRICRGVREFDVSATLEHLRDQRQGLVPTKELYELAIATIVEGTQDIFSEKL